MVPENARTFLYDTLRRGNARWFKWLVQNNLLWVYRKPILRDTLANELIRRRLGENQPLLVSRLGRVELSCIDFFIFHRRTGRSYPPEIKKGMSTNAGFFPTDDAALDRFSELVRESVRSVDVMGVWFNLHEDFICRSYCPRAKIVHLRAIEPYYHQEPWSVVLKNRTILVVHPFERSIRRRLRRRHRRRRSIWVATRRAYQTPWGIGNPYGRRNPDLVWYQRIPMG